MTDIRKRTGAKGVTYQVRYADPSSSTGYSYKTFATAKEARAFRESPKQGTASGGKTMQQAVDDWLRICQLEGRDGRAPVSAATYTYYGYIAEIIKAYRWDKRIHALAKPDIVAFRSWLIERHGRSLASKTLTYLHGVLAEMASRGEVNVNVCTGVSIHKETRYDEPLVIPSGQEIRDLLAGADRLANSPNEQIAKAWARYRPMLYLAVDSGMRPQEYVAVCGKDFRDGGIQVARAIDRSGKLSVPKTPAARRFIELSPETLELVAHYRNHVAVANKHGLVFPTSAGTWQSLDNWRKRCFAVACQEAGLIDVKEINGVNTEVPRYTPYVLRHYFASMLIADGTDIARIKTLMGHTNISTTFDVYAHLIRQADEQKRGRQGMVSRTRTEPHNQ